jgi:acyl CoA:acetate/3-ketoacid CoA transferase beta subunit
MAEAAVRPAVASYTPNEIMTVSAARLLKNGTVCFVGIGLPSAAANLARETHAPEVVLIYESGTIGTRPEVLPLSIGDGELADTADTVVSVPEIFRYWLQGGRIDVGFLGAAQIDRFANINTTVIGPYERPKTRLPGAGGAPEIATSAGEVFIILKQSSRAFVEKLDFISTAGHLTGGDSRERAGARGKGPTVVITDLGIMRPDPHTKELVLEEIHPGVMLEAVRKATGWPLKVAANLRVTVPPTACELEALRALHERTRIAHGTNKAEG